MKIGQHEINVSNLEKTFFPDTGFTKGDLIGYYRAVSPAMVPHMQRYGVSMRRLPDGLKGDGFYNKDTPDYFPDWIKTIKFPKRESGSFRAPIVDSPAALVYLADQAVVSHHLYLSPAEDLEHPDKFIFDLDPPEGSQDFSAVRAAALDLFDILKKLNWAPYVQTTGSKGFHVISPIQRKHTFDQVRQYARQIARLLVRRDPERYTLEHRKNKRQGRIFLDVLRNAYGATAVAPYSVRARPGAPVATPLDWDEVRSGASPRDWDITSIPARLAQKEDPWKSMQKYARAIHPRQKPLDQMLEAQPPAPEEQD